MAGRNDWFNRNPYRPGGAFYYTNPMEDPIAQRENREREIARLEARHRPPNDNRSHQTARPRRPTARDREEFAPWDVRAIREVYDQTQHQFAHMIGISVGTLRNWEQGKRWPQGPARALLRIMAADPNAVRKVLANNRCHEWPVAKWID